MKTKYKQALLIGILKAVLAASIPFTIASCHDDDHDGTSKNDQRSEVLPQQLNVGDQITITGVNDEEGALNLLILSDTQLELINTDRGDDEEFKFLLDYTYIESGDSYIMTIITPLSSSSFVALANDVLADENSPLSQAVNDLSDPVTSQQINTLDNELNKIDPDAYIDYDDNNDFYIETKYVFGFPKAGLDIFSYTTIGDYLSLNDNGRIALTGNTFEDIENSEGLIRYIPVLN